jgi:hypothetical protein
VVPVSPLSSFTTHISVPRGNPPFHAVRDRGACSVPWPKRFTSVRSLGILCLRKLLCKCLPGRDNNPVAHTLQFGMELLIGWKLKNEQSSTTRLPEKALHSGNGEMAFRTLRRRRPSTRGSLGCAEEIRGTPNPLDKALLRARLTLGPVIESTMPTTGGTSSYCSREATNLRRALILLRRKNIGPTTSFARSRQ